MNGRQIFLAALRGGQTPRPSVACVNQTATYEQMEAIGVRWPGANFNASQMSCLSQAAHSIIGFDAVRIPFCQTIEEEALGCEISIGDETNLPSVVGHPFGINDAPSFPENFLEEGRLPLLVKAARDVRVAVGEDVAVIGGVVGPFTIAAELLGVENMMRAILKAPQKLRPFLQAAEEAVIELARALEAGGVDAICIEDMMASMDLLSPPSYNSLAAPHEANVIERLNVPVVLHICGRVDFIAKDMIATGAAALSFEPKTDVFRVKQAIEESGKSVGIVGGIGTMDDLFYGDTELVTRTTRKAIADGYDVVAPGCSVPPATTTANLRAMVETVKSGSP